MKIVIASGKGGTGKTTLAVNLAVAMARETRVGLLDCDVEEPNCHLFLKPRFRADEPVGVPVPRVDADLCTGCGLCTRACAFHALVALPSRPLLLPELCHGCGVCEHVCPDRAISEGVREIGAIGAGDVEGVYLRWGQLRVGEARSTPLIRAVKDLSRAPALDFVVIDAPPGVACPTVEALRGADYVLLVAEPTRFGLHDLRLAVQTVREIGIPHGVVVNRVGIADDGVEQLCRQEELPILMGIPNDVRLAEACARGEVQAASDRTFADRLRALADSLRSLISASAAPQNQPALETTAS